MNTEAHHPRQDWVCSALREEIIFHSEHPYIRLLHYPLVESLVENLRGCDGGSSDIADTYSERKVFILLGMQLAMYDS